MAKIIIPEPTYKYHLCCRITRNLPKGKSIEQYCKSLVKKLKVKPDKVSDHFTENRRYSMYVFNVSERERTRLSKIIAKIDDGCLREVRVDKEVIR